jgi:8-oxo-dGTP diphosphatase
MTTRWTFGGGRSAVRRRMSTVGHEPSVTMPNRPPLSRHTPAPGAIYETRPSVYAVMLDQRNHIAVVRTPRGYFLPGGGIERGENAGAALSRECAEECGLSVSIRSHIGDAVQFLDIPEEGHFRILGRFFHCEFARGPIGPAEADHQLLWLPQDDAVRKMRRPFEAWAIRAFQGRV